MKKTLIPFLFSLVLAAGCGSGTDNSAGQDTPSGGETARSDPPIAGSPPEDSGDSSASPSASLSDTGSDTSEASAGPPASTPDSGTDTADPSSGVMPVPKFSMTGTWEMEYPEEAAGEPQVANTLTFFEDGRWELVRAFEGEERSVKGTYVLNGAELAITATEQNGQPIDPGLNEPATAILAPDGQSFAHPLMRGARFVKK
ncbi:MAG: hypothetical protein IH851_01920 [Armatimonadetes bacterium]|nr:hypothetical protein [Armatimonadota bacterium]